MKQPNNTTIYNTALYLRLSRDDELQGESGSIRTQRIWILSIRPCFNVFKVRLSSRLARGLGMKPLQKHA